jgi:multidrug resistance efflux pump
MSVQIQEPQTQPTPRGDGADGAARVPSLPHQAADPTSPTAATSRAVEAEPAIAPSHGSPAAPAGMAAPMAQAAAPRRRPAIFTRRVLLPLLAVILIVVGIVGFNAYREGQLYVSTENATLSGQQVQVGSMNAGRVDAVLVPIGSSVHKGDVLAQVALPSQVGMGQNGQPKMGFLGAGDTHVDVQAPVDGVVIAQPAAVGATVAAGSPIVTLVDPTQLWVNANIEETQIARVKAGQPVTVHVDALGADIPGKVDIVTPATAATSSILPTSNASGNFTKVTQLVPVRISVNLGNQPLLLGANVEVKIKVAN